MPSLEEHLLQADRNEQFAVATSAGEHVDWAVTALFYSALHFLEAYLAKVGEHPLGHADRDRAFEAQSALAPIWPDYRLLKDYSEEARYLCQHFTSEQFGAFYSEEFRRARDHIRGLIK